MRDLRALLERQRQHRFACLFVALLATLGARPVFEAFGSERDPFELLLGVALAVAALGLARERGMRWLVALAVAFVSTWAARALLADDSLRSAEMSLWAAGFVLATVACVRQALRPGRVDAERVFAALDAYLIVALLFGVAFWALDSVQPGSFGGAIGDDGLGLHEAIYLSFVTIATLGFGDLLPVSEAARGLVTVEAVSGQLYLAVLVARLVSLYARQDDAGPPPRG